MVAFLCIHESGRAAPGKVLWPGVLDELSSNQNTSENDQAQTICTMADSWEDDTGEKIVLPPKASLNVNAPSFSFNPGASSWAPPAAAQPAATPQQQPAATQQQPLAAQPSHAEAPAPSTAPQQADDTAMAEPDHLQGATEPAGSDVDMQQEGNAASGTQHDPPDSAAPRYAVDLPATWLSMNAVMWSFPDAVHSAQRILSKCVHQSTSAASQLVTIRTLSRPQPSTRQQTSSTA